MKCLTEAVTREAERMKMAVALETARRKVILSS
jgi:hypothetical protein